MKRPLVSVLMPTYYHEAFVGRALDSILSQRVDFPMEILVGDDGSGDGTARVIEAYAARYPGRITPVLRPQNLGANRNMHDLYGRARGKYIAYLEGDDFWSDPDKLQVQVDFLERHPQFSACCGKCLVVDENGTPDYTMTPHFTRPKKIYTLQDYVRYWDMPAQLGTFLMRNIFWGQPAEAYAILHQAHPIVGDKTLLLLLLRQGDIYCMNRVLSCYRFIIKKDGHNWFSIHHANPYWQYDGFMYPCRLERWARRHMGLRAHLGNRKEYHFMSFVQCLTERPEWTRVRFLGEMIASSHEPLRYLGKIAQAWIEKE